MDLLVQDDAVYRKSRRDPTSSYQTRNNQLVASLYEKKSIDLREKLNLVINNAVSPKLYGLPKVHKDGTPMRPVVAFIGSPTYALAKYVATLLSPLSNSPYNVKDSMELSRDINGKKLPEGFILASLDVISLFTNIPVRFALEEVERRFHEIEGHTKIEKKDFMRMLDLCLTTGYFSYNDEIYLQLDGVAMGSPISPIIADVVMQRLLDMTLGMSSLRICCVRKYVDDLLVAVHRDDVDAMLDLVNSFHDNLKFTLELEVEGKLAYLDMWLHRNEDNTLCTSWYSKPCASNRILNFNSGHAMNMILNVGRNLVRRIRMLTTKQGVDVDAQISRILQLNDFPLSVIRKLLMTQRPRDAEVDVVDAPFRSLGYIKGVSEKIKKRVTGSADVRLSLVPVERVRKFFTHLKDKVPLGLRSNVVYEIPCSGCTKKYVGTTKQFLRARLGQHQRDSRNAADKRETSALCQHVAETGHSFAFDDARVLDSHRIYSKRMFLEMLHIKND
uniref:Reverse transcriptase domain-containing protein n=1 Tax=Lutzomyia longipalpis TaxID=7200 RepID=A0A1B0CGI0_LUTLO